MTHDLPSDPQPLRRTQIAGLIALLLAAAFIRFSDITSASLWMDEIWSIEMAMGHGSVHDHLTPNIIHHDQPQLTNPAQATPWWGILNHLNGVTHPPLYFLVLRWWIDLFGPTPASVRTLSALFSLAIIAVFFDICRFLHGTKQAFFAAAIAALAVIETEFAQDARGYTMLIFLALSAADALIRIQFLGVTRRRLIALAFFALATALTHYLTVGALAALAIYAVVRLPKPARLKTLAALAVAALLCIAIWTPLFLSQKSTLTSLAPTFLREARASNHLKLTLYRIIGLPTEFLLGENDGNAFARTAPYLVLTLFLFTLILPPFRLRNRPDLLFWVLWGLLTIGFVAALDLLHDTTLVGYPRYTVLASPAIYAAIATFDWPRKRIARDLIAIIFLGFLAHAATRRTMNPAPAHEDWRQLANDLTAASKPDDLLVFYRPDPWVTSGTWFMGIQYYTPTFNHPWLVLNSPPTPEVLQTLHQYNHLWLIGIHPELQAPQLLPGWTPTYVITTTAGGACLLIPD